MMLASSISSIAGTLSGTATGPAAFFYSCLYATAVSGVIAAFASIQNLKRVVSWVALSTVIKS
jgi:hypothetical protein